MKNKINVIMIIFLIITSCITTVYANANSVECEHTGKGSYVNNGNGTHSAVCGGCGEKIATENHTYENGVCIICDAKEETSECEHTGKGSYVNNGNGTHSAVCGGCGEKIKTEKHTYKNGVCIMCKAKEKQQGNEPTGECEHTGTGSYIDNGDGTHSAVCGGCGEKIETKNHTYENGVCIICKAKEETGEEPIGECEHTEKGSHVDNGNGTHSAVCGGCGEKIATENHTYNDDACTICDAKEKEDIVVDGDYGHARLKYYVPALIVVTVLVIAIAIAIVLYKKTKNNR